MKKWIVKLPKFADTIIKVLWPVITGLFYMMGVFAIQDGSEYLGVFFILYGSIFAVDFIREDKSSTPSPQLIYLWEAKFKDEDGDELSDIFGSYKLAIEYVYQYYHPDDLMVEDNFAGCSIYDANHDSSVMAGTGHIGNIYQITVINERPLWWVDPE